MNSFPLFIATAAEGPGSTGSIMIVGFLLVVVVLALLAAITSAIGAFFARQAARAAAQAADISRQAADSHSQVAQSTSSPSPGAVSSTAASSVAVAEEPNPEDDPLLLSVIAAAIHSIAGDRAHRIVSIRSSAEGWAQEGRRQIFSSHRIR
jgi:Na+-transporting methylmalonyl-CoA/oxaloacetate decarboxylase gamma subunit